MKYLPFVIAIAALACLTFAPLGDAISSTEFSPDKEEVRQIREVIEKAYIDGIHCKQNIDLAETGFHPGFSMLVLRNGKLIKINLEKWFEMMGGSRDSMEDKGGPAVTSTFRFVDIAGPAAVAKLDVYKGGKLFATDYLSLYRFSDGWKIVSKVFTFAD